jgi:hypothetical protein
MPTFFFHSDMAGAPTNTNAAGSTLEIIRSCLVTGFNLKSVVSASVASEVMTLTYAAPHGYEDKVWLRLDGAAGGSIVQRVTTADGASSLTIPAPGFADGAVAGTLSTRVAPADWEEVFTDVGVGVFRSKVAGPGSTQFFYRFADTVSGYSQRMIRGFESMSDVNTGIGPFPTLAQQTGNGFTVQRSDSSTARSWTIVADQRTVYISLCRASSTEAQSLFFGDESPFFSSDLFLGSVSGMTALADASNYTRARIFEGTGGATAGNQRSLFGTQVLTYPSPIDGGMLFFRPVLTHNTNSASPLRGAMRGLMHCSANPVQSGSHWRIFESVTGVTGRVLCHRDNLGSLCVAFPIDEDWA